MRDRVPADEQDNLVHVVRGFFGYLCLIIFFGGVILIVQASMEVKRIRYRLTDSNIEKERLLDELRKVNNRISELEQYNFIAEKVNQTLPYLGPPRHPAIELEVPGLQIRTGQSEAPEEILADHSPLARLRNGWQKLQQRFRGWIRDLIK